MQLIQNFKQIAKGSWSVWLIALACLLSAVPVFVSLLSPGLLGVDPVLFAAAAAVVNALAIPARLIAQAGLSEALKEFRQDVRGAIRNRTAVGLALFRSDASPTARIGSWRDNSTNMRFGTGRGERAWRGC